VCTLYKEGVEIPSDYQGVIYIPMDPGDGWRLELTREFKEAGIDVDMNRLWKECSVIMRKCENRTTQYTIGG